MQTFLPYASFVESARVLDDRRLGKQRVEVLQILRAQTRERYGWKNHPVVKMWTGHQEALVAYGVTICDEWIGRGHSDTVRPQLLEFVGNEEPRSQRALARLRLLPPWLGEEALHRSHRAALLRKDPAWYGRFFDEPDVDLPYVWPQRPSA